VLLCQAGRVDTPVLPDEGEAGCEGCSGACVLCDEICRGISPAGGDDGGACTLLLYRIAVDSSDNGSSHGSNKYHFARLGLGD